MSDSQGLLWKAIGVQLAFACGLLFSLRFRHFFRFSSKKTPMLFITLFFGLLMVMLLDAGVIGAQPFIGKTLLWVHFGEGLGVVPLGVIQDPLAYLFISFFLLVGMGLGMMSPLRSCVHCTGALFLVMAGTFIVFIAATCWMLLFGIAITSIGSLIGLGSRLEVPPGEDDGAHEAAGLTFQLGCERMVGFVILFVACLMSLDVFSDTHFNGQWLHEMIGHKKAVHFFVLGAFLHVTGFPFFGLNVEVSQLAFPFQIFFAQIVPACAVLPFFMRLDRQLFDFSPYGIFLFFITFLLILAGICQKNWQQLVRAWSAAGFVMALGVLFMTTVAAGLSVFIGVMLSSLLFSLLFFCYTLKKPSFFGLPFFLLAFIPVLIAIGAPGFVSHAGFFELFDDLLGTFYFSGFMCGVAYIAYVMGAFVIAFRLIQMFFSTPVVSSVDVKKAALFLVWSLGGLSVFWTGCLTGYGLPQETDRVMKGLFAPLIILPSRMLSERFLTVTSFLFVAQVGCGMIAFWLSRLEVFQKKPAWIAVPMGFCASGYGIKLLMLGFFQGLMRFSVGVNHGVDIRFWEGFFPYAWMRVQTSFSQCIQRLDTVIRQGLMAMVDGAVMTSSRFLRLGMLGDVQFYVVMSFIFVFIMALIFF